MATKCPLVYERPRGIQTTMLAALFSVRTFAAVCARIRKTSPTMSWNATSNAPQEKPAFFLTGGQSLFYDQRFSANLFFSVRGFAGLRGRGRSLCPRWCSILSQGGKAASPASASPWRTPANRCRTRLFSALKSAVFRGSQQPLMAFPLEEPSADQEPLALLSTSRSSTLPCSKYQENHPVP